MTDASDLPPTSAPPTASAGAPTMDAARAVLRDRWGYPDFRPGQARILDAVLAGRDVLGILPTGGGKSICYQVPALLDAECGAERGGLTLVVSPLIALMQDQVAALRARGIEAAFLNSTLSHRAREQTWTDAEVGRYRLLYLAPERMTSERFRARAPRLNVTRLAIDEAHCVSEWGHHFRPDYLALADARARLGDPPTVAVTATATPAVRRDVIRHLRLRDPFVHVQGFDRPNLVWSVFATEHKRAKVRDVLAGVPGSGIVYAATRRGVETWATWLGREGVRAAAYHGGMRPAAREAAQDAWLAGDVRVMVATNAFGMGIDKPDVRFVIHVDVPASLEAYYQEAGRAGRDGATGYAVLLFQPPDAATQAALIDASHPSAKEVQAVYDAVGNLGQVPLGSMPDGPLAVRLEAVARLTKLPAAKVRTALDLLEREEAWTVLPQRRHFGLIRFRQPANALRRYAERQPNLALAAFLDTLLRSVHADAFRTWWTLDLRFLARRTKLDRARLLRGLDYLAGRDLLDWRPPGDALRVELAVPRARRFPVDGRRVAAARARAETRLAAMLRYARATACRRHLLLTHFGEAHPPRCGACDVCLGRHDPPLITPDDEPVLRAVVRAVADGRARAAWFPEDAPPPVPAYRLDTLVTWLVGEGYLTATDPLAGAYALTDAAEALMARWGDAG